MTPREIKTAKALDNCTYCPGTGPKRFAREMASLATHDPQRELTDRQRGYMNLMAWRYRRQMPAELVPASKPDDLPPRPKKVKAPLAAIFDEHGEQTDLFEGEPQ